MTWSAAVTIRFTKNYFVFDLVYTCAILTAQSWRNPTKSEAPNDLDKVDNGDDEEIARGRWVRRRS